MGAHNHDHKVNLDERFSMDDKTRKYLLGIIGAGLVLLILGIVLAMMGGHHEAAGAAHHGTHGEPWIKRLFGNFLINNFFFTGFALLSLFFMAISIVSNGAWYVVIRRIPEALSEFLPIGGILLILGFFAGSGYLYIWSDPEALKLDHHAAVISKKLGYLNWTGYFIRMVIFIAIWVLFQFMYKKAFSKEEEGAEAAKNSFYGTFSLSAIFLFVFALTFSFASWDWIMSIEPAWFSTMFAVFTFASVFVSALAFMTLVILYLKTNGYLSFVNDYHIHDMGKFVFAFSIFWTYIWFCEFMLIWYANIPEETFYFYNRLHSPLFVTLFFGKVLTNFILPFLVLMTRDAKRNYKTLAYVCIAVICGHWADFYLAIMPATVGHDAGLGPMEIGMFMLYFGGVAFFVFNRLSQKSLVPKNHPYLEESLHHHFI